MGTAPRRSLPEEVVVPARPREISRTLVGAVVLAAILNACAGGLLDWRSPNRGFRVIEAKWKMLDRMQQPVDLLVLGDSSGNQAVVPSVLTQELGGRSANLCMIGNLLAVGDAWMLQAYLQKFPPPKAVLLVHVWDGWSRGMERLKPVLMKVPQPWGFWSRFDPPLSFTLKEQLGLLLARYVPLYSENTSLARILKAPAILLKDDFILEPDGYMPIQKPDPKYTAYDGRRHKKLLKGRVFRMSELNERALARIRALADQYGFTVYIADAPIYDGLYEDPTFRAYFAEVRRTLQDFAQTSPRLRYLTREPMVFSGNEMTNADHLAHAASLKYTQAIASKIQAQQRRTASQLAPQLALQ